MWHRRGGFSCFPFEFYGARFGFAFHSPRRWRREEYLHALEEYREELQEELQKVERENAELKAEAGGHS